MARVDLFQLRDILDQIEYFSNHVGKREGELLYYEYFFVISYSFTWFLLLLQLCVFMLSVSGPVEADPEYQCIIEANNITVEMDNEISKYCY